MFRSGSGLLAASLAMAFTTAAPEPSCVAPPAAAAAPAAENVVPPVGWSAIVSRETLESEIKAQPAAIDEALKSPDPRKSVRMAMTYSAVLFGMVDRYEGDIAWKKESHALRDAFAESSRNLKAWTPPLKAEVTALKAELAGTIQGKKPQRTATRDRGAPWSEIAERPPLMHRLELGHRDRLAGWAADAAAVKQNAQAVIREAEIMAMLGRILQDKSYEFSDDKTYRLMAKELEKQAAEVAAATKRGDGTGASSAVGRMQAACNGCHAAFR